MKLLTHYIAPLFMLSLMIMGMAGLPFLLFDAAKPSPNIIVGLRLVFVGILALMVGTFTGYKAPLKRGFSKVDVKDWLIFIGLAVVGVNCSLTYALYYLDDRMAMAVMLSAIGLVFVWHHPQSYAAWLASILAVIGIVLLIVYAPAAANENIVEASTADKNDVVGYILAVVGGLSQGTMNFRKRLMPRNIDPGLALGAAFLVGGLGMLTVSLFVSPPSEPLIQMPLVLAAMGGSALMTVVGWLILTYAGHRMSGAQKSGAASFEPVGAAVTQFVQSGLPFVGEVIAVLLLISSTLMAQRLEKDKSD